MSLKKLIKARESVTASLSRLSKFLKEFQEDDFTKLKVRAEVLKSLWSKFDDIQSEIEGHDNVAAEECEAKRTIFEDEYYEVKEQFEKLLNKIQAQPMESIKNEHSNSSIPKINLPSLNIPLFSGNYTEWRSFQDMFTSVIINNNQLSGIQKFYYLKSSLKGEPLQNIEAITISEENFEIAWALLTDRYNNKQFIVNTHLKCLFEATVSNNSVTNLRKIITETKQHLRSLQALGIPVEHWDAVIIYLVTQKINPSLRKAWELNKKGTELPKLSSLFEFLETRCLAFELIGEKDSTTSRERDKQVKGLNRVSYVTTKKVTDFECKVCRGKHRLYHCEKFLKMNVKDRINAVKAANLCFNCLDTQCRANTCTSGKCKICSKKHNTLIHIGYSNQNEKNESNDTPDQELPDDTSVNASVSSLSNLTEKTQVLLSTAIVLVHDSQGKKQEARVLLDSASQSSFVTSALVKRLGLKCSQQPTHVSGINQASAKVNTSTSIHLWSRLNSFNRIVNCLILNTITCDLPSQHIKHEQWKIPQKISLADPNFNKPNKIDILLGADIFFDCLRQGHINLSPGLPILQQTTFGWVVSGKVVSNENLSSTHSMLTINVDTGIISEQLQKFWSIEEIQGKNLRTKEEQHCEKHFEDTISRTEGGRYVVTLLLRDNPARLGDSVEQSKRRFYSLEKRFVSNPSLLSQYSAFIQEYIDLNHMELVPVEQLENIPSYYLPHHAVMRESSSTTKLRVVFDASMKTSNGISLNDLLMNGPVLQSDLISIVLRFRTHRYVLTADIVKMYRQVLVNPKQTDLQRIWWRNSPQEELKSYRLKTVTYGTASAPYLATKCLQQVAKDEGKDHMASSVIAQDFYMDDMLTGSNSILDAKQLQEQVTEFLRKGGFELRKWCSNDERLLQHIPEEHQERKLPLKFENSGIIKTLGLTWQPKDDYFRFSIHINHELIVTKRSLLSDIARIFDPLGLIGPVILKAKLFLQILWKLNLDWDNLIPSDLANDWLSFRGNLNHINEIKIPRNVISCPEPKTVQIHGFCDASEHAYGCVIYMRCEDNMGNVFIKLFTSKSRVAPLKQITVPRLELCGALLLSRLLQKVIQSICLCYNGIFLWTDSSIVLAWISAPPTKWKSFVATRVSEIQEITNKCQWNHVSTTCNPADLISRGMSPREIANSVLWWNGPHWLYDSEEMWPTKVTKVVKEVPEAKKVKSTTHIVTQEVEFMNKFSSWNKLVRITAYVFRFCNNCRSRQRESDVLSTKELLAAKIFWYKYVQSCEFLKEFTKLKQGQLVSPKSKLRSLHPFLDSDGIMRVGGRLEHALVSANQKHPVILPSKHNITKMIFREIHNTYLHIGPQALLAVMRQQYWPLGGKTLAKQIVYQCIKCFKVKPRTSTPIMGQLPQSRVIPARAFLKTGVDFCGPILLRQSSHRKAAHIKAYISVFVCMCTKAVHLELVSDLSSEAFMAALRRFMSRRGKCQELFSDNGTNFVGARRMLSEFQKFFLNNANQEKLKEVLHNEEIKWNFIPPSSPHFGGLWEASVKAVKYHLRRTMGMACLTFEEVYTLLTQIEACLNSRPLTPLSNDPSDYSVLTPAHFLIGESLILPREPDESNVPINRLKRWRLIQAMFQKFWKRWSNEYLTQLQPRSKWTQQSINLRENDLVLIKEDNTAPLHWQLARVLKVHAGNDGVVRVATVKTTTSELRRPVVKLCKLPLED